jgi:iron complex outermembrane recepter protein
MFAHPLYRGAALALACSVSFSVTADDLAPVKVTASRTVSISEQLPVGMIVINREMLEKSRARNTAELLDSVAGLTVRRLYGVNGSRASVDLLGFGSGGNDNTLVLLNGRRLNNPDMSDINFSAIPLAAIERIEILPGSGSTLYGYGASGGVINIITRSAYDNAAGVQVTVGDYNTTAADIWAAVQGGNTGVIANLRDYSSDGYRDNNDVSHRSGFVDARTNLDGVTLYMTVLGDQERLGLPGARTEAELVSDRRGATTPDDRADQNGYHLMPGVEVMNGLVRFNLDGGYRQRNQNADYAAFGAYRSDITSKTLAPRFSGELEVAGALNRWTAGWDGQWIRADVDSPFGASVSERDDSTWYLHNVAAVTERWSLTLGARRSELVTRYDDGFSPVRTADDVDMYQGGVRFMPTAGFALFANAERSARLANFDEFSYTDGTPLKPQTGVLYTAGAEWRQANQFSVLTFWQGRFDNEILFDPDANGGWGANINLDDRTLREGMTLNSRWQLDRAVGMTINGSLQRAVFDSGANQGNDIPLVAEKTGYLLFDWQLLEPVTLAVAHRYIGKRYLGGDEDNAQPRLNSYTWTDVFVSGRLQQATLTAGIYNIENRKVVDSGFYNMFSGASYYPLPDRHVLFTLGFSW